MLVSSDPFERVGEFAADAAQTTVLQLASWQCPPCWIRNLNAALKLPERRAAELLLRCRRAASASTIRTLAALDEAENPLPPSAA
jgi:hypothetical protein